MISIILALFIYFAAIISPPPAQAIVWCDCPCGTWCSWCNDTVARSCVMTTLAPPCYQNEDCSSTQIDVYSCEGPRKCCSQPGNEVACPYNEGLCYNDCGDGGGGDGGGGATPTPAPIRGCAVTDITFPAAVYAGADTNFSASFNYQSTTITQALFTFGTQTGTISNPSSPTPPITLTAPTTAGTHPVTVSLSGTYSVTCSRTEDVTVIAPTTTITANVYNETDGTDSNGCSSSTLVSAFTPSLTLRNAVNTIVGTHNGASNSFSVTSTPDSPTNQYMLTVGNIPTAWIPLSACGSHPDRTHHFNTGNMLTPVTMDFYYTQRFSAWWQAAGGDVYASGSNTNTVPETAVTRFTTPNSVGTASSGVLIAGNNNSGVNYSGPPGRQWKANNSFYTTASRQGYSYFTTLLEVGTMTDSVLTDAIASLTSPYIALTDGNQVHYQDGDLEITSMIINAGELHTIFVNGTVTVSGNISVANGGFLAIIATGNITFGPLATDVDGIYITDSSLIVENADPSLSNLDRQFNGSGIFVGWGGVSLNRTLNTAATDLYNNSNPAVRFTYRPDFLINAPDSFKYATVSWREVVPE
jgi:hypothetical protein